MIQVPRLLLVDDDLELRSAVIRDLERMGYVGVGAPGVETALQEIERGVDVLLLDLELSGGESGYSLVRECEQRGYHLPTIVISGTGNIDDVIQVFRSGATDFLRKPFHRTELALAVERALAAGVAGPPPAAAPAPVHSAPALANTAPAPTPAAPVSAPRSAPSLARPVPTSPAPAAAPPGARPKVARSRFRRAAAPATEPAPEPKREEVRKSAIEQFQTDLEKGNITLPNLGPMAAKIQELLTRPTCSMDEVVRLIETDPSAAAEVLRVSNTARYRGPRAITTLPDACLRLGNTRVLGIAQEVLVRNALAVGAGPLRDVGERMWKNTLVVAQGARLLAGKVKGVDADTVYLAGLLHNVGELVLVRLYSDLHSGSGGDIDMASLEPQIEALHQGVGSKVLRSWKMAPVMIRIASEHHKSRAAPWSRGDLATRDLVMLAWHTAAELGYAWQAEAPEGPSEKLLRGTGLTAEVVLEVFSKAGEWS
jgi:HD-like signal output (HDOD) protein/CheY-like chemotaxis protein